MLGIACDHTLKSQGERFNKHVRDGALMRESSTLFPHLLVPELVSGYSVLPNPRLTMTDANFTQKHGLQRIVTLKRGCQFDVRHGTNHKPILRVTRQASRRGYSKRRIV